MWNAVVIEARQDIAVLVWPNLISTGDIQLSFTMTLSNPSTVPADEAD